MQSIKISHFSVLYKEVIEFIGVSKGGDFLDATYGHGGHSRLLLSHGANKVYAIDRDAQAIEQYGPTESEAKKLVLKKGCFSDVDRLYPDHLFDGILMDLGVSSLQLLEPGRGFSFSGAGPLDMRMDRSEPNDLEGLLSVTSSEDLAEFFAKKAMISNPRKVAQRVKNAFEKGQLKNTSDLANLFPKKPWDATHPATPVFLGLRMMLNKELEEIERAIPAMIKKLKAGGRLVVLSFHSSEDGLVKRLFRHYSNICICESQPCFCQPLDWMHLVTRKAVKPSAEELSLNPRSRSALLRCVEKKVAAQ